MTMRSFFFSSRLNRGYEWQICVRAIIVAIVSVYATFYLSVLFAKTTESFADALEIVQILVFGLTVIAFLHVRYNLFIAFFAAMGSALLVRGLYGTDEWLWLLEFGFGFWLLLRMISIGPRHYAARRT